MKLIAAFFDKTTTTAVAGGVTATVMPWVEQLTVVSQLIAQWVGIAIAVVVLIIRLKEMKK